MFIYYIIITAASIGLVIASYLGYHVQGISATATNAGMILLRVTMLVKPFMIIASRYTTNTRILTPLRWGMRYRRLLGITTFLLIFTHGGIYFANRITTGYSFAAQIQSGYLLAGYVGAFMLLIGYLTSNNRSLKKFGKYRKPIQYTAYAALVLGILHLVLLNPGDYRWHVVLLAIYIFLKFIEKKKQPQPTIQ